MLCGYLRYSLPNAPEELIRAVANELSADDLLASLGTHLGLNCLIRTAEFPPSQKSLSNSFKALLAVMERQRYVSTLLSLPVSFEICWRGWGCWLIGLGPRSMHNSLNSTVSADHHPEEWHCYDTNPCKVCRRRYKTVAVHIGWPQVKQLHKANFCIAYSLLLYFRQDIGAFVVSPNEILILSPLITIYRNFGNRSSHFF